VDAWRRGPFVFASSQTVYGIPADVLRETDPVEASCWYDIAKICNEQQVHMASYVGARRAGVSLRLPLVFASGARRRDRQFLPPVFDALVSGHTFLFEREQSLETYGTVYIAAEDLAESIADSLAIEQQGPYNLAGGFCTWKELLESIGRHTGVAPKWMVRADTTARAGDFRLPQSRSFYDCQRFEQVTPHRTRRPLDDVIGDFVRSEQEAGHMKPVKQRIWFWDRIARRKKAAAF
jgi:nucleoside-diphosphate-sugar epimerase